MPWKLGNTPFSTGESTLALSNWYTSPIPTSTHHLTWASPAFPVDNLPQKEDMVMTEAASGPNPSPCQRKPSHLCPARFLRAVLINSADRMSWVSDAPSPGS